MEAWLSQRGISFTTRDVVREPITEDEFAALIIDPEGRIRVPFTRVGAAVVLGFDPVRLREYLGEDAQAPVIVHGRDGDLSSDQLIAHLRAEGIPHALRDVDQDPLSLAELWGMLIIPSRGLRTPYTVIGDELVLGCDIPKLERVLGLSKV